MKVWYALVALALALAGCSSSGGGGAAKPSDLNDQTGGGARE